MLWEEHINEVKEDSCYSIINATVHKNCASIQICAAYLEKVAKKSENYKRAQEYQFQVARETLSGSNEGGPKLLAHCH